MSPRVLFVSKAIGPPFHDGTKCLVRDLSRHLERVRPQVMSTGLSNIPGVDHFPVYSRSAAFSPSRADNAQALAWLVLHSRADLWHFVFAPNPASSAAGRVARGLRRVPVVQTVASPPATFEGIGPLLFGDVVVVHSTHTRDQIITASRRVPRMAVIPPCVAALPMPSPDEQSAVRRELTIPMSAPLFVYPGDLEVSSAAETVARSVQALTRSRPDAVVVFACRHKTPRAPDIQRKLAQGLPAERVRFVPEIRRIHALLATADIVLFPAEDLRGKVDLPIVLLETMLFGTPVVACSEGPLADLEGVRKVAPGRPEQLVQVALELASDGAARTETIQAQRAAVRDHYDARVVARLYERLYLALLSPTGVPRAH